VIGPNPKLFPKKLWSELGEGEPVRVVDADNEEHEAERAVARIQSLRARAASQHKEWRDFAVLYRANHQAKPFEQALRAAQIPYKVSGGQSFFDRAEIKDLCAWLRLWSTTTTTRPSCAPSPRPSAASATRRWASLGEFAGKYS
jgi:ATP-dependent DNA helicase Rep